PASLGAPRELRRALRLGDGDDRGRGRARDGARMAPRVVLPEGAGEAARRCVRAVRVRQLGAGDEAIVERLAEDEPQTALLRDPKAVFLVALDDDGAPMGFLLGYELLRRHGDPSILFVYEVDVVPGNRRRGVATQLFRALAEIARARRIETG